MSDTTSKAPPKTAREEALDLLDTVPGFGGPEVVRRALEEAVSLYDECRTILNVHLTAAQKASAEIVDFDRRRAALELRLNRTKV